MKFPTQRNQCFCGNSYGSYGTATNCNVTCSANPNENCGGFWANSVYYTSLYSKGYMGCYADTATRDLSSFSIQTATNSVKYCISQCANLGYAYAGVQFG